MAVHNDEAAEPTYRHAESLIRDLKSAHLSSSSKLALSVATWRDSNTVLPRKQKILTDLLVRELIRSANNAQSDIADTGDHAFLNASYWDFLTELLSSVPDEAKALLVPPGLLQVFGAVFQNGRSPASDLVKALAQCFKLLYAHNDSKSTALPKFENFLQLLVVMNEAFVKDNHFQDGDASVSAYLTVLWDTFAWMQARQPNQRKVFQAVVGKLLEPALRTRQKASSTALVQSIDLALTNALFHEDHLSDYGGAFRAGDKQNGQPAVISYPRQLFDNLRSLVANPVAADSTRGAFAHLLLGGFLTAVRNKLKESDNQRSLQLSFFQELYAILGLDMKEADHAVMEKKLGVLKDMLLVLSRCGVYNPADDTLTTAVSTKAHAVTAAKRNISAAILAWLKTLVDELIRFLLVHKSSYPPELVCELFGCLRSTLSFTHLAVNDCLPELWRIIWVAEKRYSAGTDSAGTAFAGDLLNTYTKLRQLDRLADAMLPRLTDTLEPFITRHLMEFFERSVQEVPSGQLAPMLTQLMTFLRDNFFLSIASGTDELSDAQLVQLLYTVDVAKAFISNMVMSESSARALEKSLSVALAMVLELVLNDTIKDSSDNDTCLFCGLSLFVSLVNAKFLQTLTTNRDDVDYGISSTFVVQTAKAVFKGQARATPRIQYVLALCLLQQLRIEEHLDIAAASKGVHSQSGSRGERWDKCNELTAILMGAAESVFNNSWRPNLQTEWHGDASKIESTEIFALALWQLICQHLPTLQYYFTAEHISLVARALVNIVAAVGHTYNHTAAMHSTHPVNSWAAVTAALLTDAAFVESRGIVAAVVAYVASALSQVIKDILVELDHATKKRKSGKGTAGVKANAEVADLLVEEKLPNDFAERVRAMFSATRDASNVLSQDIEGACDRAYGLLQGVHALPVRDLDIRTAERCMRLAVVADAVATALVTSSGKMLTLAMVSREVLGAIYSGQAYSDRPSRVLSAETLMLIVDSTISSPAMGAAHADIALGMVRQYLRRNHQHSHAYDKFLGPLQDYFCSMATSVAKAASITTPAAASAKAFSSKRKAIDSAEQSKPDHYLTRQDTCKLSFCVSYFTAMSDVGEVARASAVRQSLLALVASATSSTSDDSHMAIDPAITSALAAILNEPETGSFNSDLLKPALFSLRQVTMYLGLHLCGGDAPSDGSAVIPALTYLRVFCARYCRLPETMRHDVFQRLLALLLSSGAGAVQHRREDVLESITSAMCELKRCCDAAEMEAITDLFHEEINCLARHPWQALDRPDVQKVLHRAQAAAAMLCAIYRDRLTGTGKGTRGTLKRAVQPVMCTIQAAMHILKAAVASVTDAEDIRLTLSLHLLRVVDAMVSMHDFSFGAAEFSLAVSITLLCPAVPTPLRSCMCQDVCCMPELPEPHGDFNINAAAMAMALFNGRYGVLQQLARRYPEPLTQCLPVMIASVRALLLELVGSMHDSVLGQGTDENCCGRCVENMARLLQELAAHKDATSKHAPYLLADYIGVIQTRVVSAHVKAALLPGIYAVLDLCGEHERALLHAFLDTPGRLIFKSLHNDYSEHYKYTGKY